MYQVKLIISVLLFLFLNSIVFYFVYSIQSEPFIDEIFHIPQTIKYCKGVFDEWDPKITTLPGLYILSVGVLKPLSSISGVELCDVSGLRSINVVVSAINYYFMYAITKLLHPDINKQWKLMVTALNLAMLPPMYFFTFLYYTDIVSTCLVLLCYLLHLRHKPWLAATAGFIAVTTRQTNIVWLAFIGFETVVEFLKEEAVLHRKKKITSTVESSFKYLQILKFVVTDLLKQDTYRVGYFMGRLLASVVGYVLVGLLFLVFVIYNGGIVVGDKAAHSATIHLPQLLYFSLFALIYNSPQFVVKVKRFSQAARLRWSYCIVGLCVCVAVIHFNSMVHPYTLADNRHYTFYIWKRLLSKPLLRYLVTPFYMFGLYCIQDSIKHKSITFQIAYWFSVIVILVPQKLLEVRYFIIPYLLFKLQVKPGSSWQLLLELLISFTVNALTIYLFATKTFYWQDSPHPQRIIW